MASTLPPPVPYPLISGNVIGTGDSIMEWNDQDSVGIYADNWFNYANWYSGGRLNHVGNFGIGGQTSTQILARLAANIATAQSRVNNGRIGACFIQMGSNDASVLTPAQMAVTFKANYIAAIQMLLANGIMPILVTIPPRGVEAIGTTPTISSILTGTTGGSIAGGTTVGYRIVAANGGFGGSGTGYTLPGAEVTLAIPSGTNTNWAMPVWGAVPGALGYRIYGRTPGSELLIAQQLNNGRTMAGCYYQDLGTITPSGALPSSDTTQINAPAGAEPSTTIANSIICRLARQFGLPLIDFYTLLCDPATGLYTSKFSRDGTHPTNTKFNAMGQYAWAQIAQYFAPSAQYLCRDLNDPNILGGNPLFYSTSSGVPTGWSYGGSGSNITRSVTTDPAVSGQVYKLVTTDYVAYYDKGPVIGGFDIGDTIAITGMFKASGPTANGGTCSIGLLCNGASPTSYIGFTQVSDDTNGWYEFSYEAQVPAGTTSLQWSSVMAQGPATWEFGNLTVRNLTQMGIF
jgi:lysophospholipase L1-like esterase